MCPADVFSFAHTEVHQSSNIRSVWELSRTSPCSIRDLVAGKPLFQKRKPSSDQKWYKFRKKRCVGLKKADEHISVERMGHPPHWKEISLPVVYPGLQAILWVRHVNWGERNLRINTKWSRSRLRTDTGCWVCHTVPVVLGWPGSF